MTAPDLPATGAFFDLSARVKVRVTGGDRLRFLNGQLTNDIRGASESRSLEACILNAKGKTDAHVFVTRRANSFLLDADAELRGPLQPRLARYIIADDVEVEDVTEKLSILHVLSSERPATDPDLTTSAADRFGVPGWDIWMTSDARDQIAAQISEQLRFCDADCAETFRIEQGIPRWDHELTPEIIPLEANLESRCINYEKGCYIGQEVISRMKMSGQRNKRLCGLISLTATPLAPGMRLYPADDERKEIGSITSAAQSSRLRRSVALAYVKRGFNSTGATLTAGAPDGASSRFHVQIVDLPFQ
jgi:folate-binding protein YgfZ